MNQKLKEGCQQVIAGGSAGLVEVLCMYPLDVVKTRMQVNKVYGSMLSCMQATLKNEGIGGFYKGIFAPIMAETPKRSTKFFSFEQYKTFLLVTDLPVPLVMSTAGLLSGFTEALIICPFEVVKIRLQSDLLTKRSEQRSVPSIAAQIIRSEGIGCNGIYRGLTATLMRHGIWNMIYFGLYYGSMDYLMPNEENPSIGIRFLLGLIAGTLASTCNIPCDVAKSRIQGPQPDANSRKYHSLIQTIRVVRREEGFKTLYHGLLPKCLRLGPGGAIITQFPIREEYLSQVKKLYDSGAESVDFNQKDETAEKINSFVQNTTNNEIDSIIEPSDISTDIIALLVNALYFKADWDKQFKSQNNWESEFYNSPTTSRKVVYLKEKNTRCGYIEDQSWKVLKLNYIDKSFAFHVFLPAIRFGLSENLKSLNASTFQHLLINNVQSDLDIYIPKMKIESEIALEKTFRKMGIERIFTENSDLSNLSKSATISKIVHKTKIQVDEKGTTASAATSVKIVKKTRIFDPKVVEFKADHPFLFIVSKNGLPLFIGVDWKQLECSTQLAISLLRHLDLHEFSVISPLSISFALAMVHSMANGETKNQIHQVLAKGLSDGEIQNEFLALSIYLKESEKCQGLKLRYADKRFAFHVLLPVTRFGLKEALEKLDEAQLLHTFTNNEQCAVNIKIPKMDIESDYNLQKTLENLGIENIFKKHCDLSNLANGLYISKISHKAKIRIEKEGTVASACTSFEIARKRRKTDSVVHFTADHPFVYFLTKDHHILFLGIYS
ncbi:unnamed protein product [Caenorhabditis bovis]|uniref:Serpin domain-containing protein n=1 Tax=Caenorhabditis bovis TaxID=2654633 RepID=A0A8S1EBM6_9PELO|nr:unnamed protein product [Caenorhabditis bovis]